MAIPHQVIKQGEEADRLLKEFQGQQSADTGQPPTSQMPTDQGEDTQQPENQPIEGLPAQEFAPNRETTVEQHDGVDPQQPEPQSDKDYKHRYQTLQGKFNREVPALHQKLSQLTEENQALQARVIAFLEAQSGTATQPKPDTLPAEKPKNDLAQKFRDEGFEDLAVAVEAHEHKLEKRLAEIQKAQQQVEGRQSQTAQQAYYAELQRQVPDWNAINEDDGFRNWLAETDPFSGEMRNDLLVRAHNDQDPGRVSAFFNTWKQQQNTAVGNTPQDPGVNRKQRLESQVSPTTGRTQTTENKNKPAYTAENIRKFFQDKANGVYRGREDEAKRTEDDIMAAQQEGRIVL